MVWSGIIISFSFRELSSISGVKERVRSNAGSSSVPTSPLSEPVLWSAVARAWGRRAKVFQDFPTPTKEHRSTYRRLGKWEITFCL